MNKLLVFSMLMMCQMICFLGLSIIAPFFPPYAQGKGISLVVVGLIFSANPVGAISGSLLVGKIMTENNRFKFMLSALIMQGLGLFLFGVTNFQDQAGHIISTAVISRLINGIATSFFQIPLYAYIPVLFPESIEQKVSVAEIIAGLGFLLGPVFGSQIYQIGGYLAPFVLIGSLSLFLVPIIAVFFYRLNLIQAQNKILNCDSPDKQQISNDQSPLKAGEIINPDLIQDQSQKDTNQNSSPQLDHIIDDTPLEYFQVLKSYPVLMISVNGFMANFMYNFFPPILADYYDNEYGASPSTIGYYLCVMPITYSVTALIVGNIKRGKIQILMIGGFIIGLSAIFVGPDQRLTGLQHKYYLTLIAIGLLGIGGAPMVVYNVPVINDYLLVNYPKQPTQCANMASALFNFTTFLGELLAPLLSGLLVHLYSFDTACSALGFLCLLQAVLFIPVLTYRLEVSPKINHEQRSENIL